MKKSTLNLSNKFAKSKELRQGQVESLQERITVLEAQLEQNGQIQEVPLDRIRVNPNQPRTSFYVVQQMAETLKRDGQKQPIILTQPPGEDSALLFDGECRVRAARSLNWKTLKALFIPYNQETFDNDVLIASIFNESLNSLDLATSIAKYCQKKLPNLTEVEIATKLNTALVRLRRQKKQETIKQLDKFDLEKQQVVLNSLELGSEELAIFSAILYFKRNLFLISNHKFPFLKLSLDLKTAIRERGLGDSQALAINAVKSSNKKLKIEEVRAGEIRRELIDKVCEYTLNVAETKKEIAKALAPYLNKSEEQEGEQEFQKTLARLNSIKTDNLNSERRSALISALKEKIQELTENA